MIVRSMRQSGRSLSSGARVPLWPGCQYEAFGTTATPVREAASPLIVESLLVLASPRAACDARAFLPARARHSRPARELVGAAIRAARHRNERSWAAHPVGSIRR